MKAVQKGQTKFLQPGPALQGVDSGGNGVRETSRTGLPRMIPTMSIRLADLAMAIDLGEGKKGQKSVNMVCERPLGT